MAGLALAYFRGKGVEANHALAATFARRAADLGDASSNHLLGLLLRQGDGVEKDGDEGLARFVVAAKLGSKACAQWLAEREKVEGPLKPEIARRAFAIIAGFPGSRMNVGRRENDAGHPPDGTAPASETPL